MAAGERGVSGKDPREEERRREAQSVLERAERESETVLRSTFEGAHRSKAGGGAEEDDAIERLGRKIGRGAGAVFALGLVAYLVWTYL